MLNKKLMSKGIARDIIIVAIGVLVIWMCVLVGFGDQNPVYVVASGSMIPVLQVNDIIVIQGDCFDFLNILKSNCIKFDWYTPFENIEVGDIIVFNRPSGHDRVIVHRVASVIDDEPKTVRTKGDANPASIPGTDFPITEKEYIGKVTVIIPQLGLVTKIIAPPFNYIIIVIVLGIMVVKQMTKKKNEKEDSLQDLFKKSDTSTESTADIPELDKLEKDKAYSNHDNDSSTEAEKQDSEKEQPNIGPEKGNAYSNNDSDSAKAEKQDSEKEQK